LQEASYKTKAYLTAVHRRLRTDAENAEEMQREEKNIETPRLDDGAINIG